jgi:hypothetical protein
MFGYGIVGTLTVICLVVEHAQTAFLTLKAERAANGNALESTDLIRVGPLSEETC